MATPSGRQALSRQFLCVIPVLVDLCQRANKTGPLIVPWNRNLLGERGGKQQRYDSTSKHRRLQGHEITGNLTSVTES